MRTKLLLVFCFFTIQFVTAQEIYLISGKNFTSYDYKNSNGEANSNLRGGNGNYYEIGYEHILNKKISYLGGLTFNQFNANGANGVDTYTWNTNYLGVQNAIAYTLLKTSNELEIKLKASINTCTIIQGEQLINATYYDLTKQNEFTGILFQPGIGLQLKYVITDFFSLSLGYTTSKVFTNASTESLSFVNNQVQFGLYFPL